MPLQARWPLRPRLRWGAVLPAGRGRRSIRPVAEAFSHLRAHSCPNFCASWDTSAVDSTDTRFFSATWNSLSYFRFLPYYQFPAKKEKGSGDRKMEREIVTVALGNYSNLIAAQWANGTTRYDADHRALFVEQRHSSSANEDTRSAPRLVMLDNHHGTRVTKEVPLEWGGEATAEEHHMDPQSAAMQLSTHHQWYNEGDDGKEDELDGDDDVEFDDFSYMNANQGDDGLAAEAKDMPEHEIEREKRLDQRDKTNAKAIFDVRDHFVPWVKYIRSGLHPRTYSLLKDLHAEVRGASLLHSVGYGKHSLRPSANSDIEGTCDSIRSMLETCDHCQGFQFFVDGDTCFSGAAANILGDVVEECGSKLSRFVAAAFEPFLTMNADDDFFKVRQDELVLNRALTTSWLSAAGSLYVPFHVDQWDKFKELSGAAHMAPSSCNTSSAQMIATMWDTATYGLRLGGGPQDNAPLLCMADMERILRSSDCMRLTAAFAAVPLRLRLAGDEDEDPCFWTMAQRNTLFPLTKRDPNSASLPSSFLPLSHDIRHEAFSDAGRVIGHCVSLRGVKGLMDKVYPREEAVLRYVHPLRTSTFHAAVLREEYPISDTFPANVLLPDDAATSASAADLGLTSVPVGAQLACTYNSAPMVQELVASYDKVWRYRRHVHKDSYLMEDDEWREVSEDLHQVYDDYNHGEMTD